jgi:hypothetical protein
MDPLSITASAVALGFKFGKTILDLKEVFSRYHEVPQSLEDLEEEASIIRSSLAQLQRVLQQHPTLVRTPNLQNVFDLAVKGSEATLLCIESEFSSLMARSDWRAKISALWKEPDMIRLVRRLERKKASIVLLIQCLNM